jgi:hypothetical protein
MTNYPGADTKTQNFAKAFKGDAMSPNVVVLHTTEGRSWPGYKNGGSAPTMTIRPLMGKQAFAIRQHFPLEMSARALKNVDGGVETNTLNCIQIELMGTCDPKHRKSWGPTAKAGKDYIFWPEAPDWALRELGEVLATLHKVFPAIPLKAMPAGKWLAFPASFGTKNGQRMTGAAWRKFAGVCGHMHVPENVHGDPGNLDITRVLAFAKGKAGPNEPSEVTRIRTALAERNTLPYGELAALIKRGKAPYAAASKELRDKVRPAASRWLIQMTPKPVKKTAKKTAGK